MTKLKRVKNETELEELLRLFRDRTIKYKADTIGNLILVETKDEQVITYLKGKGLIE